MSRIRSQWHSQSYIFTHLLCGLLASTLVGCDAGQQTAPMMDMTTPDRFIPSVTDRGIVDMNLSDARILGEFLDSCQSNDDCASGWCIAVEDGRSICTRRCLRRQDCPDDWDCRLIDNTPPDIVSACMPRGDRLCGVCERDSDCPNGVCRVLDGESVCISDCETDEDCPSEYSCEEFEGNLSCIPKTRSCSCNAAQAGELRICENANDFGRCFGRQTCDPESGWGDCSATVPAPETCNQIDDDCNGFTDDIPGLGELCEREAEIDGQPIACSGRLICTADSEDPICTANEPMAEMCNFLDDDCDGETDEGFEGRGDVCVVGLGTCQRIGVSECSEDGASVACSVAAGEPAEELCDGLDNDCDGQLDETFEGLNELCFAGEGACRAAGAVRCSEDLSSAVCSAQAREPSVESCNGIDDDCDNQVDEGFDDLFTSCTDGIGACLRQGFRACSADGLSVACSAVAAEPAAESCNGLDDDCDGTTDEGFANVNTACTVGVGACRRSGVTVCDADGVSVVCGAEEAPPSEETCNGLDDDCDGTSDETFDALNQACSVGVGTCRVFGVTECNADGDDVECPVEAAEPSVESCNALDDDCDGSTDEGYVGLGEACSVGVGACLRQGVSECSAAGDGVECPVEAGAPVAETCNALDDDCDGRTDEAFADVGSACVRGTGICLRRGVTLCSESGDGTECSVVAGEPGEETCNGLDDDCDGNIDETFQTLGSVCTVGTGTCLRAGVEICTADGQGTQCSEMPGMPSVEVCNGVDDDCDGESDETHPDLGGICETGVGLCRRSGVFVCSQDPGAPVECDAVAGEAAAIDTCNYQDDDCDGSSDEDFVDAAGLYGTVEHCGACGSNCNSLWAPTPEAFGVRTTCNAAGGVAQCGFECLAGFFDADGLSGNGCEFRPDADAVYTTTPENGGLDGPDCGGFEQPCATISRGIARATELAKSTVRVGEGAYRESIQLTNGVSVLGGHQRLTWVRNPVAFPSVLTGLNGRIDGHVFAVSARDITEPTTFDGFVVNGESQLNGNGNSYGIYIYDSTNALTITNNRIAAGNGGRGEDGASGASGTPGTAGASGLRAFNRRTPGGCQAISYNDGGAGGARLCNGVDASGGDGGDALCPRLNRREGSGVDGAGAGGGVGGLGGGGLEASDTLNSCGVSDDIPVDASPGQDGASGADGPGAPGANIAAGQPGIHWNGTAGASGTNGAPGSGGGGGGAAAGVDIPILNESDIGASGGGGGSGGCNGVGGSGAEPGGGSFGIYIAFENRAPLNAAGFPTIRDNLVARGLGGPGGRGGTGGGGGEGGPGGAGGPRGLADDVVMDFCSFQAGLGGTGGRGGHGGGGGGGQGGISFDIYVFGAGVARAPLAENNDFTLADNAATGGPGGDGGNSSNTQIGLGGAAVDGLSGQVRYAQ